MRRVEALNLRVSGKCPGFQRGVPDSEIKPNLLKPERGQQQTLLKPNILSIQFGSSLRREPNTLLQHLGEERYSRR